MTTFVPPALLGSQLGTFYSRGEAIAAAAAGGIPARITSITTGYHTTSGDNGGARYRRVTAAQLAAYGMGTLTLAAAAFPDASGGYWLLDEPAPHLAQFGCFPQELGVQPVTTAAYDCSDIIEAAGEYGALVFDGAELHYGNGNYYLHKMTDLPDRVGLSGPSTQGSTILQPPDMESVAGINWMPGMVINPAVSLRVGDNFYSEFLCVKRAGIVVHTDAVGALDSQGTFAGVGVTKTPGGSSRNVKIKNFAAYGFAFGFIAEKMHGFRFGDVYGDCTTLVLGLDCGETVSVDEPAKRKPVLSINDAIKDTTVGVTSLYNAGGKVGLVTDADVLARGLSTGQRVGNQKLTGPFDNILRTVTVTDGTHVILEGTTWDAAYASWTPNPKSSITWNPGMSSGVAAFYNAGGSVGVRTIAAMPFNPGHKALLACGGLPPKGMRPVVTRVSPTDFVLDVAWDAGLLALNLDDCELAASPQDRTHSSTISYWGTTEGFGMAFENCDGVRAQLATKGGSGIYLNSASAVLMGASNEGAGTGNTDRDTPGTTGMRVRQPRALVLGAFLKSTAVAMDWDMEDQTDSATVVGAQFTDGGEASFRLKRGRAVLLGVTTRGPARVLLNDATMGVSSSLDILHGEIDPANVIGTPTRKLQMSNRRRVGTAIEQVAGEWQFLCWNPSTGAAERKLTVNSSGVTVTPQALTVSSGSLTLTDSHHGAHLVLDGTGTGIALDAASVLDGFTIRIVNLRGSDWSWPSPTNGTVQIIGFYVGTPTKVRNNGEVTLTVRVVGGNRKVLLRGDLTV